MNNIDIISVAYILKNYCYFQKEKSCKECIFKLKDSENICPLQGSPSDWSLKEIKL